MKNLKIYKLLILIFATTMAISCIQDDDFDTPALTVEPPVLHGTEITIDALKQLLVTEQTNNGNDILTIEEDYYITGYVISNDEFGNFFEEILLQDAPENPTTGVKVLVNVNPLFATYEFGREVHVQLQGLAVGYDSGVLALGVRNGNQVDQIGEAQMTDYLKRDVTVAEMVPMPMNIADFSVDKTNLFIQLSDMQFHRNELGKTFSAEETDSFDGERVLESCATGQTAIFSTSTFADFKAVTLPEGKGTMNAILTMNFFGDAFNVVVNSPDDIHFDDTNRCDPTEVDCGLASTTGSNVIFEDFFETQTDGQPISGNGWTNYIEAGTRDWRAFFSSSTNASLGISATIGSFQSGDDSTIAWLITPQFDFDAQDGETLNFKTSNSFADGSTLDLLYSSDWDGNPANITSATWDIVPAAYIVQDGDFFGDWFDSGNVSLDCITGTGYIALRYTGSGDADFDGSYEFDEIVINSN
jgi:hypothetical protein